MAKILAAKVDLSDVIIERGLFDLIPGEFNTRETAAINGKRFFLPIERIGFEPFDPLLQKRTGPVDDVQPTKVVETYTVVNKTAQELDDEKTAKADQDLNITASKAVAAEVWIRDEELVDAINAIIIQAGLSVPQIQKLTATGELTNDFRTRIKDRYKSLLP